MKSRDLVRFVKVLKRADEIFFLFFINMFNVFYALNSLFLLRK